MKKSITVLLIIGFIILTGCATTKYPKVLSRTECKELFEMNSKNFVINEQLIGNWVVDDGLYQYEFRDDGTVSETHLSRSISKVEYEYKLTPEYILLLNKNEYAYKAYFFRDDDLFMYGYFRKKSKRFNESNFVKYRKGLNTYTLALEAFNRGKAASKLGDFDLAITEYTKAIEIENRYTEASQAIEEMQIQIAASTAAKDPAVLAGYLKKLEENPSDETTFKIISFLYSGYGDKVLKPEALNNAITSGKRAITQNPNDKDLKFRIANICKLQGNMYSDRKDYKNAMASIKEFASYIKISPVADAAFKAGDYASVLMGYRMIYSQINWTGYKAYTDLFYSAIRAGDIITAKGAYDEIKTYEDKDERYKIEEMANTLQKHEKRIQAIPIYELANTYRDKKDYVNALIQYRKALDLYPEYTDAIKNFSTVRDKYLAENPILYPAPFQGTWYYTIPASLYKEPDKSGGKERKVDRGREYEVEKIIPGRTITIPESEVICQFTGKNYTLIYDNDTKTLTGKLNVATGTFIYYGNIIELDNGTILRYDNTTISVVSDAFSGFVKDILSLTGRTFRK
jgi:tetratricopeptide (TPR) repeat protein